MPAWEYVEAEFLGRYLWNYYGAILSVDVRTAMFAALMAVNKSVPWGAFDPPPAPDSRARHRRDGHGVPPRR